jgi:xylulokinase
MKFKDSVYLGLDVGTTHIKVAAYNGQGELKGIARVSTPAHVTKDGGIYHLAPELWSSTVKAIQMCVDQLQGSKIKSIGIASMAEAGVLLDASDEPVGPILAWYDPRPGQYLETVRQKVPALDFYRRTGLYPQSKYSLLKFLWMKEHMPDVWNKARSWLHVAEYIAFCLTGNKRTEMSLASRTLLFNINQLDWDHGLAREFGIKSELLQPVVPSAKVCGTVRKEASEYTKIPEGTPVTIAGHDHIVGSFGIGGTMEGDVTNSCGTAETLVAAIPKMDMGQFAEVPIFTIGCHVLPNRYYTLLSVGTTGGIVEWFLHVTGWNYEQLLETLSREDVATSGLGFYPILYGDRGTENSVQMGWFGGALTQAYPGQLASAMIRGLCCLFRYRMNVLKEYNIQTDRLLVTGGSSKNPFWMQGKADILNRPLQIVRDSEGVARGAAILSAKANQFMGEIPIPPSVTVTPNPENARQLEAHYEQYLKNIDLFRQLSVQ